MKRSLITTLIIGVAVALIVSVLHASGLIARFELAVSGLISNYAGATRVVGEKWQPGIVLPLSLGVAWLALSSVPRRRSRLLVLFLLIELLGLSWSARSIGSFSNRSPLFLQWSSRGLRGRDGLSF